MRKARLSHLLVQVAVVHVSRQAVLHHRVMNHVRVTITHLPASQVIHHLLHRSRQRIRPRANRSLLPLILEVLQPRIHLVAHRLHHLTVVVRIPVHLQLRH